MSAGSVVPPRRAIGEEDFHVAMVAGLARAQKAAGGRKALAFVMDLSPKALGNILAGGSTDPKRLWDALDVDPTALDDVARLYGRKVVPGDAICTSDGRLSLSTVALLSKAIAAEIDGVESHSELLDMEMEMLELRVLLDARLERCAALRAPRAVA